MIDITSLRSNAYLQDVLDQPRALRDTLSALATTDLSPLHALVGKLASGELRRVVLTGMGSSYHALHPAYLRLVAQGLNVHRVETSELLHHAPALIAPESLLVVVSQSGQSVEIRQLLEKVSGPLIAVTNSDDNPLALKSSLALVTQAGPEATVSCKTYTAALAVLAVLSEVLVGGEAGPVLAELAQVPETAARYLAGWESHIQEAGEQLDGVRYLVYAGRGPSLAAVGTASLITKEAAHFPADGMSSAAFRHGPFEMTSPELFVLVYEGDGPAAKLNAALCNDVQAAGGRSALVTCADAPGVFSLPYVPSLALPILEMLPAQMVSMALALQGGRAPGVFERGSKVTTTE